MDFLDVLNAALNDDRREDNLRTGARTAVLCLYEAGYLGGDALAYAFALGHEDVPFDLVLGLGTKTDKDDFQRDVKAAVASESGTAVLDALANRLNTIEGELYGGDADAGNAGGADAGAVPAGDEA